jgi:hypothetical protein
MDRVFGCCVRVWLFFFGYIYFLRLVRYESFSFSFFLCYLFLWLIVLTDGWLCGLWYWMIVSTQFWLRGNMMRIMGGRFNGFLQVCFERVSTQVFPKETPRSDPGCILLKIL